jgi:hypothetical protein
MLLSQARSDLHHNNAILVSDRNRGAWRRTGLRRAVE